MKLRNMKNRNVMTKLALLVTTFTVLLIGVTIAPGQGTQGAAQAQTINRFGHRHASMLPEEGRHSTDVAPSVTHRANNETSHVTAVTPQPPGQPGYRILDLGGSDSRGITESGDVVGASEGPFPYSCGGAPFRGRFGPTTTKEALTSAHYLV